MIKNRGETIDEEGVFCCCCCCCIDCEDDLVFLTKGVIGDSNECVEAEDDSREGFKFSIIGSSFDEKCELLLGDLLFPL